MLKVLIVEDDLLIADLTKEVLVENGFAVCGVARTVDEAVALGRQHEPDLAIIDMQLADGGNGTDVAPQLNAVGRLGVLYATGSAADIMQDAGAGHACILKPYSGADLVRALQIVSEIVMTGRASPPFPREFALLPHSGVAGE